MSARPPPIFYPDPDEHDLGEAHRAEPFDPRALLAALRRQGGLIATLIAVALLLSMGSVILSTPRFRAVASIQIDQRSARVLNGEDVDPIGSAAEADRFLQTQVDILESRALAIRVAAMLHLDRGSGFFRAMGAAPPASLGDRREEAVALLQSHLRITLPRNSRLVSIAFDSRDPDMAAAVANAYAQGFITGNLQRRFATSQYSRAFLQDQLARTKTRLEGSERALITYARAAGLVDASAAGAGGEGVGAPRSLTAANLVGLNSAYAAARATRIQAEQRWRQSAASPVTTLPEVLNDPAVQQLTGQRAALAGEIEQLRQRFKPDHPTLRQAQARFLAVDAQIRDLAAGQLGALEDQYRTAAKQETALARSLAALKAETLAEQGRGIRYAILKREADTNRELYDGLLARYKQVSAEAGIASNNVSIVDTAEPPRRPVWPRPALNIALGLAGGTALALLAAWLRERMDDRMRTPADVAALGLPLLGTVPPLGAVGPGALPRHPEGVLDEELADAFGAIRIALDRGSGTGVPPHLLVTGSRRGEGRTTTALALARELASDRRVLLIDADLRQPALHRRPGCDTGPGLSGLLAEHEGGTHGEAVRATAVAGLDVLPAGPAVSHPGRLLIGPAWPALLARFDRYDVVVIDGPPVLDLPDALRLAGTVAATLFVVAAGRSEAAKVARALDRLGRARAEVVGAILVSHDPR